MLDLKIDTSDEYKFWRRVAELGMKEDHLTLTVLSIVEALAYAESSINVDGKLYLTSEDGSGRCRCCIHTCRDKENANVST